MTKEEHVNYWITTSNDDWETVKSLFESKRYVHCLYFAHLCLEKLCKSHWVKDNESNTPPKIHSLVKIISNTNLELDDELLDFLRQMDNFHIEGRYPDYLMKINIVCNKDFTNKILIKVEEIKVCLQEKMQ